MKRVVLGLGIAAVAALTATPASAETGVKYCNATVINPCGVCVEQKPVYSCT